MAKLMTTPERASSTHAESAFGFLRDRGFRLVDRLVSHGSSYRDGWQLQFASSTVRIRVQYLDMQFEVHFDRAGVHTDYLFVDRERFHRRSGFHGNMFPAQKLGAVIDQVAADIRDNYTQLLDGDAAEWANLARLLAAPAPKRGLPCYGCPTTARSRRRPRLLHGPGCLSDGCAAAAADAGR
jgi:hypothetical protein